MEQAKRLSFRAIALFFLVPAVLAMAAGNSNAAYAYVNESEARDAEGDGDAMGNDSKAADEKNITEADSQDAQGNAGSKKSGQEETTVPSSAAAAVTEHIVTDSDGNVLQDVTKDGTSDGNGGHAETGGTDLPESGRGILTSGLDLKAKGEAPETDIPAVQDSGLPFTETVLPGNETAGEDEDSTADGETDETGTEDDVSIDGPQETDGVQEKKEKRRPGIAYAILAILGAAAAGAGYYFKVVKKRDDGDFVEDEEEEYDPDYESEETEKEDDFFQG